MLSLRPHLCARQARPTQLHLMCDPPVEIYTADLQLRSSVVTSAALQ